MAEQIATRDRGRMAAIWDEMAAGDGRIRAHWRDLFGVLAHLGAEEVAARGERLRQQLEDDGVTFNLYGGEDGPRAGAGRLQARPWALDAVPVVIAAQEWRAIERGIVQRARLLDSILADLHGPQALLAERRYPPRLVFGSPEFLRPCLTGGDGARPCFVQHYAADLARGQDGIWRVVADRVQAPAGAAFATHHRRAMMRSMGEAFAACRIRPIASFFETWGADLRARATAGAANPLVVVLTPGPFNEAHAEHASLARELGATLAQGADLSVRDRRVFLKTLGGLEPVGTLLRRVDGAWCDPLELRADSTLGVPGLVDAARAGGVFVANALGAALVEAPAMAAFLPRLCERLLGESLRLPSIAAWWCGQSYARDEVMARLPDLVLRPALAADGAPIDMQTLDDGARATWLARLRADPAGFVAQERVVPSQAPGEGAGALHPQPIILRVFATADGEGYAVMPGGLARVPSASDPLRAGLQQGGTNKDVWVVADDAYADAASDHRTGPARVTIRRTSGEVPSRAADDLFWLGRSVERLDCCGRALRSALQRAVGGTAGVRERIELEATLRLLERCGVLAIGSAGYVASGAPAQRTLLAAFGAGGLVESTLSTIERLASAARDRFSADMRRTLSHMLAELRRRRAGAHADPGQALDLLDEALRLSAAVSGLASENMTRGSGWRFLDLGRRVERGIHVARVTSQIGEVPAGAVDAGLRLALELCDSTISYRTRYLAALLEAPVLDLLLLDVTNPQSLAFQIEGACAHVAALPRPGDDDLSRAARAELGELGAIVARLGVADPAGRAACATGLRAALMRAELALMALSDGLNASYFALVGDGRVIGAP